MSLDFLFPKNCLVSRRSRIYKLGKLLWITIVYLFLTLSSTAQDTIQLIQNGEEFLERREYSAAYTSYQNAVKNNPHSIKATIGLAESAYHLQKWKEAEYNFLRVIKSQPENTRAIVGLSQTYLRIGHPEKALEFLNPLLEENPYNPDLLPAQCEVFLASGRIDSAIQRLQFGLKQYPGNPKLLDMLGKAYSVQGHYGHSRKIFSELIESAPDNPDYYFGRAANYLLSSQTKSEPNNNIDLAIHDLQTVLSLQENHWEAMHLLAKAFFFEHRYSESKSLLDNLLVEFPRNIPYLYLRSLDNLHLNSTEAGLQDLEKILKLDDLNNHSRFLAEELVIQTESEISPFRSALGLYRKQRFRSNRSSYLFDTSSFHFLRAKKLIPSDREIMNSALGIYKNQNRYDKYIELLVLMRDRFPKDQKIQFELENSLDRLKEQLSYKTGLLRITPNGLQSEIRRTPQKIFVFDSQEMQYLSDTPEMAKILREALEELLQYQPELEVIQGERRKSILNKMENEIRPDPYNGSIAWQERLEKFLESGFTPDENIRYVLYSKMLPGKHSLSVHWTLRDRLENKTIATFRTFSRGRDILAETSSRVARNIVENIRPVGKVIRLDEGAILVNMGSVDGLKVGDSLEIHSSSAGILELKITQIDLFLSRIQVSDSRIYRQIGTGDLVTWKKKK